jgi:hypothetical protein
MKRNAQLSPLTDEVQAQHVISVRISCAMAIPFPITRMPDSPRQLTAAEFSSWKVLKRGSKAPRWGFRVKARPAVSFAP